MLDKSVDSDWTTVFNKLKSSDLPPAAKVRRAFEWVVNGYLEQGEGEIQVLKAMGDQQSLVKEQIKLSTMQHTLDIFHHCYQYMVGGSVGDE
jgi:hypothetical protein